jgi:hypothetical protein
METRDHPRQRDDLKQRKAPPRRHDLKQIKASPRREEEEALILFLSIQACGIKPRD